MNQKDQTKYQSALVHKSTDTVVIDIMPPLNLAEFDIKSSMSGAIGYEAINLTDYLVYRINYSQTLPSEDVLQR